jgi:hypothetical protein
MAEHRWSGWPGAWCLDCGKSDPREEKLANGELHWDENDMPVVKVTEEEMTCAEPGSNRHNPYARKEGS